MTQPLIAVKRAATIAVYFVLAAVTDSVYRSANEPYNGCGSPSCALGAGSSPLGIQGRIDAILAAHPDIYHGPDGRPLTPQAPGGNVLNIVVPH